MYICTSCITKYINRSMARFFTKCGICDEVATCHNIAGKLEPIPVEEIDLDRILDGR